MRRDLDVARSILRQVEDSPTVGTWVELAVDGHTDEEISYHVMLLAKEGLIDASDLSSSDGYVWKPLRLTWAGHEFLDAARDESRWAQAKAIVLKKGGSLTFDVLKAVLIELMKRAVL